MKSEEGNTPILVGAAQLIHRDDDDVAASPSPLAM